MNVQPGDALVGQGADAAVEAFREVVGPRWQDVRELRWRQPHLVIDNDTDLADLTPVVRRIVAALGTR